MCKLEGFDVVYAEKRTYLEPHFCRIYGDCGGGYTFEEAKKTVADYYRELANRIEATKNYDDYCLTY